MTMDPIDRNQAPTAPGLASFCRDDSGTIMATVAILMPLLLGAAGLGVDIGSWQNAKRQAQAAADAAARAGALELLRGRTDSVARQAAREDSAAYGYDQSAIEINLPPESGAHLGDDTAVEAIIELESPSFFARHFLKASVTVHARAVAKVVSLNTCLWALEQEEPGLEIVGTADVTLDCGVQVNSIHEAALDQRGSACLSAASIDVVGGVNGSCLTPVPRIGSAVSPDPFSDLEAPDHAGCDHSGKLTITKSTTLWPGTYCGDIGISGKSTVTFEPGVYVLKGGTFKASGNASLIGEDVTFYLTDGSQLDINAASLDLSAPDSGEFDKILFFQDRDEPETIANKITGNSGLELSGALYFPSTELHFRGVSSSAIASPVIVARVIRFVGTTSLGGNNVDPPIVVKKAELVE